MNKTLVALAGIASVMVVGYFGYELLAPNLNQCESIFQQTAPGLQTNVKFLESEGDIALGRKQIQELSDRAQEIALNLKSCCVMAGTGNLAEFNQCKQSAALYDKQVAEAVQAVKSVTEASAGDQSQKQKEAEQRLAAIIQSANEASAALQQQVNTISARQPNTDQSSTGNASEPQGPGKVRLRAALTDGGERIGACFDIYEPEEDLQGNRKQVARSCDDPALFELPSGNYVLFATAGYTSVQSSLSVTASGTTDQVVPLNAGYLNTHAELSKDGERLHACFDVFETKKDLQGNRKQAARACEQQAQFLLPAGDYVLYAQAGYAIASTDVRIAAGGAIDQPMVLNAGYLRPYSELISGGEQVRACYDILDAKKDLQGNFKQIARSCDADTRLTLPAGEYTLLAQFGNATTTLLVNVMAGQAHEQAVVLNAGYLRAQAQFADESKPVRACFEVYEVKEDVYGNRKQINRECTEKSVFTLPAGDYVLKAQAEDAAADMTVSVKPGDITDAMMRLEKP